MYPVGSVIKLKNLEKRVMIVGWFQIDEMGNNWDYSCCFFPEGVQSPDGFIMVNNNQIEKIFFIGCQDEVQLNYSEQIIEFMKMEFPKEQFHEDKE